MPCQIAICSFVNSFNPGNPRAPQRGDFVAVVATDWVFTPGDLEGNIIITVSDATVAEMKPLIASWIQKPVFTLDSVDEQSDVLRITVRGEQANWRGEAGIPDNEADAVLRIWQGARFSSAAGKVTFDISVTDAARSTGFLDFDTSVVDFVETSYTNGVHTIELDARRNQVDTEAVQRQVNIRTVTSIRTPDFVTYDVDRDLIQRTLLGSFQGFLKRQVGMRRFSVMEQLLADAEANGQRVTKTAFQLSLQTKNLTNG